MDSKAMSSSAPPPPSPPPPPPPFATTLSQSVPKKVMSERNIPPPPPRHSRKVPIPFQLHKSKSWSPSIHQEQVWHRHRENHLRRRRSTSATTLTDSDLAELKACFELGFAFDSSSKLDPKLSKTFPALEFYHDVLNKKFAKSLARSSSLPSLKDRGSPASRTKSIIEPGDDAEMVKMKLRHWAQVVACSLHVPSPK